MPIISEEAGGGGTGALHSAAASLTDAQIKALPSTGVVLVADPGSGVFIVPVVFMLRMNPAAFTAYTNIDPGAAIYLGSLSPVFEEAESAVSGLLATPPYGDAVVVAEQTLSVPPVKLTRANWGWQDTDLAGALSLSASNNVAGNFAGGAAGNSLMVALSYFLFDSATGAFV